MESLSALNHTWIFLFQFRRFAWFRSNSSGYPSIQARDASFITSQLRVISRSIILKKALVNLSKSINTLLTSFWFKMIKSGVYFQNTSWCLSWIILVWLAQQFSHSRLIHNLLKNHIDFRASTSRVWSIYRGRIARMVLQWSGHATVILNKTIHPFKCIILLSKVVKRSPNRSASLSLSPSKT